MKKLLKLALVPTLFLQLFCTCAGYAGPILPALAKKGVLDLRNQDLYAKPLALNGEWVFYWDQLLQPGDPGREPAFVSFPSLWKKNKINGHSLSSQGYATYKLTVLLPQKRPSLALEMPDVYTTYALYANGKLIAQNGQPGKNASEARPFWSTTTVYLQQPSDTLYLVLQVANFWHSKGGPYKEILIGKDDRLYLKRERDSAYDLVLTGCLFMGGLFFLGLYLFGQKDKAILYFSLFCILYSYRLIGTRFYVLHSLFPYLNWFISVRLEYLTLSLGVALFAQYTRCMYSEDANPVIMKTMVWFCLLYSVTVLLTPPIFFTSLINLFLCIMFLCLAYAFYVTIEAARKKRNGSRYALFSTAVVLIVFFIINLDYFGIMSPMKGMVFAGYICFFFLQSLALSHRFAHSFRQAAWQARQGLKAKSEFLSTMSHEVRTPLNAVIGITHLLLRNKPREDQRKDLDVLLFSANNLLSIVNNILDYNKIEAGKIHFEQIPMDLDAIARNIIAGFKMTAAEKGIDLQLAIDDNEQIQTLIGDPTRTSQVINNLVHNAIKFTREGWVRLSIRADEVSNESVTATITVEDTGIGIPAEKQQLIFERFTQADSSTSRSYGGTGLGLAISKKILELQGTRLLLKSEPGNGSLFYFKQTFLLNKDIQPAQRHNGHEYPKANELLKGISILLVEDNPLNVLVAQTLLENGGARIDVAANGSEALDIFDPARHELILMDLHMPVMDGYEATGQFRQRGETLPIIALTANTVQEVAAEAYAAGLTDIVAKPFNPDNLYRVILRHVSVVGNRRQPIS